MVWDDTCLQPLWFGLFPRSGLPHPRVFLAPKSFLRGVCIRLGVRGGQSKPVRGREVGSGALGLTAATVIPEDMFGRGSLQPAPCSPCFSRSPPHAAPQPLFLSSGGGRVGLARRPYRLWGAAHGHLHVVALAGLAPQVVYHLHKAAPPAGLLGLLVGLPGQPQPQGATPQPTSQGQPDAGLGAVGRQHPGAHPQK